MRSLVFTETAIIDTIATVKIKAVIAPNSGTVEIVSAIVCDGTVMVSESVETVPPNAKTLPVMLTVLPIVTPDASSMVPAKLLFAPSVVAPVGTQVTLEACAPLDSVTAE